MNRTTFSLLAGLVLGSLISSASVAQAQVTNAPRPSLRTNAPGARPVMRDRTDYWAMRLGLNDEQKAKIKPIFDEETQKMAELRKHTDLKPEERRSKLLGIRQETDAKLKTILTPEQWDKYSKPPQARPNSPAVRMTNAVPAAPAK
jgi:Spy/CpxP family protein refolding chaperone